MVTIGVDLHKRTHTLVCSDGVGRQLAHHTVTATAAGHAEALGWGRQWPERTWALEDCRQVSRRFEGDLVRAGERVVRVPPKLTVESRRGARTRGKSDPIDALAVARAALREPDLPVAQLDGPARDLRLLVDHRDDFVAERTRLQNRLRWLLHELDPGCEPGPRRLDRKRVLDVLDARLEQTTTRVGRIARELVARNRELTVRIKELEREIVGLIKAAAPLLLELSGCGPLSAAKIVGETAGIRRFKSRSAFAMHTGTAPIPVWSGNTTHHRLNRGGNRQLNAALHRIAVTQLRLDGPGREYFERRCASGDTKTAAIRALRRRLSDEVFRRLRIDESGTSPHSFQAA